MIMSSLCRASLLHFVVMVSYWCCDRAAAAEPHSSFLRGGDLRLLKRRGGRTSSGSTYRSSGSYGYDDDDDDELGAGAAIGIVIGVILFFVICCCIKYHVAAAAEEEDNQQNASVQKKDGIVPQVHNQVGNIAATRSVGPGLLTATVYKAMPNQPTGISFYRDYPGAIVSRVHPDSLFAGTDVVPKAKVVAINNQIVKSGPGATDMIRERTGLVTMLVLTEGGRAPTRPLVTATVMKDFSTSLTGVAFRALPGGGGVYISAVKENSLFTVTDLQPGMPVLSINNKKPMSATEAGKIVGEASSIVTILAESSYSVEESNDNTTSLIRTKSNAVVVMEVTIAKEKPTSKTGIAFKSLSNGHVIISGISDGSLFQGTGLETGMHVVSINGQTPRSPTEAGQFVGSAHSTVTIVAEQEVEDGFMESTTASSTEETETFEAFSYDNYNTSVKEKSQMNDDIDDIDQTATSSITQSIYTPDPPKPKENKSNAASTTVYPFRPARASRSALDP